MPNIISSLLRIVVPLQYMKNSSAQIQIHGQQMLQTQSLSPLQVLIARLLQLTTVEMEERVRGEVIDNPALETGSDTGEELIMGDYRSEDDIPDYKLNGLPQSAEQQAYAYASTTSFYDFLLDQLHEQPLSEEQMAIGEYLIGSLDEDGLLHKPLLTIADELLYTTASMWRSTP